jgi:beta-lactamase superfamily II metal-dependent hydrolase
VLYNFPVRYYMDNGRAHTTATYRDLMETLLRSNVTYLEPVARELSLGSVRLVVLPPPNASDLNNTCIGLIVELGAFRALLTADSELEQIDYLLRRGMPPVQVLKAAHHGSDDAVSREWLVTTQPEVVVISVGANNAFGSPHPRALQLYATATSAIYRTDWHGEVIVGMYADGSYEVMTAHGN